MCICEAGRIIEPIRHTCLMTPLTTHGGRGGANDQDFLGFCDYPPPRSAFCPKVPLRHSFRFCQPTPPSPRVRPLPPQVQPFGFRSRGLMKLNLPTLEGSRIGRPQGHKVIESDNFVFPRAWVQVAARYACHRQQAGRWSDRPARRCLSLLCLTSSVKAQEAERRGPRPAGYPSNIPEFRTEMPFLTDFLVGGYSELPPSNRNGPRCCFWPMGVHKMLWLPALWIRRIPLQGALNSEANPR
jgi:hypothetical protein